MQTIRTLIVDDEARIRRGIARLVLSCGEGWEVVATAGDGYQALEYLRLTQGAVDLLITDVKMPEMDGLALIREAKKQYTFYPLLISGYDDFGYVQAALREGALDYLLKPVDREQFRLRMTEIRSKIASGRFHFQKWLEMEKEAGKLKETRQTRTLGYITSAEIDMLSLGDWVDEFPRGKYMLSYIRLDTMPVKARSYTARDWKAYFFALENIIGEVVSNHLAHSDRLGWCWRGADSDFWALLFTPDAEWKLESDALDVSAEIRTAVHTYTPFTVSVACGDPVEDLYLLPGAKRQALGLMNYRFLYGGNQLFRPKAEEQEGKTIDMRLLPIVQNLKRSVQQANAEEAAELIARLFDELDRMDSPALLQQTVQNAVILIHSAGWESSGGAAGADTVEQELHHMKKAASLHDLKQFVKRFAGQVIREIRKSRERGTMKPVEQAKDWIQEHLEQELTIKKIADHVHMNPTYFCEYFKMQTGETILDYLTTQRMDKAKELLRDPRQKLQDISLRVGYHDVKYFSRLFKQRTGQTPSKFREQTGSC